MVTLPPMFPFVLDPDKICFGMRKRMNHKTRYGLHPAMDMAWLWRVGTETRRDLDKKNRT